MLGETQKQIEQIYQPKCQTFFLICFFIIIFQKITVLNFLKTCNKFHFSIFTICIFFLILLLFLNIFLANSQHFQEHGDVFETPFIFSHLNSRFCFSPRKALLSLSSQAKIRQLQIFGCFSRSTSRTVLEQRRKDACTISSILVNVITSTSMSD